MTISVTNPPRTRAADPHVQLSERPRLADLPEGRFGRLFPELPGQQAGGDALLKYGAADGPLEDRPGVNQALGEDNSRIPAGWAFFGQFIAHDITHDRAPLQETEEVSTLTNFRSPRLDLECIYGAGPVGQPYLYDVHDPDKLLIGPSDSPIGDLPRNSQGLALVGDARNDTHVFISQLHLAFFPSASVRIWYRNCSKREPRSAGLPESLLSRLSSPMEPIDSVTPRFARHT